MLVLENSFYTLIIWKLILQNSKNKKLLINWFINN